MPVDKAPVEPGPLAQPEPQILRIFVSYASEDRPIAVAIAVALQAALGEAFAEINIDQSFLKAGLDFKKQIENALERTDILIIVYSGVEKQSFGFTGWEVGYFARVMREKADRTIVPLYFEALPATASEFHGIGLGIAKDKLILSPTAFEAQNVVSVTDPFVVFIKAQQYVVDAKRVANGFTRRANPLDPVECVRKVRSEIYSVLRTKVETSVRPQKQLMFSTTGSALQASAPNLPDDARLQPVGAGSPMTVFGLPDTPLTWGEFLAATDSHRYYDTWRFALTSVIASSFPDKVNVDNSKVIISEDDSKSYRIILSSCTKCFDDRREFSIYLVETLQANDYGDDATSLLLKGLGIVCRFRFMFLESSSEFASHNISALSLTNLHREATRLLQEMEMLQRDSRAAGLEQPNVWNKYIDGARVVTMFRDFEPRALTLKNVCSGILTQVCPTNELEPLREELVNAIVDIETTMREVNSLLIKAMGKKLIAMSEGDKSPEDD